MSSTILAVDDEESINDLICDALSLAGYRTIRARHGMEALHILREQSVDLVILDVNMPNVDGFEVLRRLRESGDATPVIILTARQDRDDTKRGFELGADDFVRKPFGLEELTLRVAAVLRRSSAPSTARTLAVGRIVLDEEQHRATCDGATVELSPTEFRLLALLMRHAGKVMTKEQLLGQVWGISGGAETTVVETYVSYLRRKFGEHISIRTVRAVGYQMVEPGTAR